MLILGVLFNLAFTKVDAQKCQLSGKIVDKTNNESIVGAIVSLTLVKDSTVAYNELANNSGYFTINARQGLYRLKISSLGYQDYRLVVNLNGQAKNMGTVALLTNPKVLDEVVVEGQRAPVVQKGDTTEMSASAYKVNVDADAMNLVQKMPGITMDNGTVKAHGEEIKRVLVDGKNFYGDDVSLALQNLPADMVDKVQIFDKLSDQAEFTGFDDGSGQKVMNIVTRADRRYGKNGKFTVGHGDGNKYLAAGRLNMMRDQQRISITGGSNNVNQQNFSAQDLIGSMSVGGGKGGASPYIGKQNGINTTSAAGINFDGNLGKKLSVNGSYFFNKQGNTTNQTNNMEYLGIMDTVRQAKYQDQFSNSSSDNYNHRLDMRVEMQIDSFNSVIWTPRFSIQQNTRRSDGNSSKYTLPDFPLLESLNRSSTDGLGYNYSSGLTLRHKFQKRGRTISLGLNGSGSVKNTDKLVYSDVESRLDTIIKNQKNDIDIDGSSLSAKLSYTEPVGKNGILMLSYTNALNHGSTNRYVYDVSAEPNTRLDSVSNVYETDYNTQRVGLSYKVKPGLKMNADFGGEYQYSDLSGEATFPRSGKVEKTFRNFLPTARLNYKYSKNLNFLLLYRTSTDQPSVTQLQNVVDVSNTTSFSKGNPDLKPEYSQNLLFHLRTSNPEKFTNFSFNVYSNYTLDPIGNKTLVMLNDTVIQGQRLLQNGQLTMPVNMKDSWDNQLFMNYGFLFKPLKCNFNFSGGAGYSTRPGYVNQRKSITKINNLNGGAVIASNISENVDFTAAYNIHYSKANNSVQSALNSETYNHSISLASSFTIWRSWVLQNTVNELINRGYSGGYNTDYLLWNASLGKKLLKDKSLQLSVNLYDALNQNRSISRSVSELAITDSRTNILGRYFMISLTYTPKKYRSGNERGMKRNQMPDDMPSRMPRGEKFDSMPAN